MIDRRALLSDLRRQLRLLEGDLAGRAESVPELGAALDAEYRAARDAERTAATFSVWRAGELTQAAVAWLLGCVFVRFIEDNRLIDEPLISGPHPRDRDAADSQTFYFRDHPTATYRDYLLHCFSSVARLPALAKLYDRRHNPVWRLGISGDAARDLLWFWRLVNPDTNLLHHDFTDPTWDTRFLGDLYQDLSEDAKKRYALLQTPVFVEEFILERTLTPALEEFGLADTRLIDPACGSGHFLLGAFHRLLERWREAGAPACERVQRALRAVYGVDVNPFAAEIARFRLALAALRASGIERLDGAPRFEINIAVGDSLLHGRRFGELDLGSGAEEHLESRSEFSHAFRSEDLDDLNRILGQQYHVVVGNPPYVTVKDKALSQLYRARYSTCHRKYAMSVPFAERLFELAIPGDTNQAAGYVGQITANSFMKREFGKKLIESFLPGVDLTHVIDASGAYIPGHGTPTVVIVGRARKPSTETVTCVMGLRGEPSLPAIPAQGKVWTAIVDQVNRPESESEWISVVDYERRHLRAHPWSLGGGASVDLQRIMNERASTTLGKLTAIGIVAISGQDEVFSRSRRKDFERLGSVSQVLREFVEGDLVRDWSISPASTCLYDYDLDGEWIGSTLPYTVLWPFRTTLGSRATFSKQTYFEEGRLWCDWHQVTFDRVRTPLSIAFAFVATHNHFVFDRGGKLFNRSAPVIKLPEDATEADHLGLVGLLNSSITCFWMKQVLHDKGGSGSWERRYEHSCTAIQRFPLPPSGPVDIAHQIDRLAAERQAHLPAQLADRFPMTREELDAHRDAAAGLLARMIALQEELDWECYRLYGVIDEDCRYANGPGHAAEPPPLALGERAFEMVMARRMAAGELETRWFERHGAAPVTDLPAHWPDAYRALVARRIELIESHRFIGLLERPEYKRRWNVESWQEQERRALRGWLLDRLESPRYWPEPRLATVRDLAILAGDDADFHKVADRLWEDLYPDHTRMIADLVAAEHVPALPAQRYKPPGLAKRADWEAVWAAQRRQDELAAETEADAPPPADLVPPPKYRAADFLKPSYWRLRGALDVPKERFVSFPAMSRDDDPTLLLGWAGWDALTLCQAVGTYYIDAKIKERRDADRLAPLLAVIHENLPWLKQWHNEVDPDFEVRLGDYYETFFYSESAALRIAAEAAKDLEPGRGGQPTRTREPVPPATRPSPGVGRAEQGGPVAAGPLTNAALFPILVLALVLGAKYIE